MSENLYKESRFLSSILGREDAFSQRNWLELQALQYDFLIEKGLTPSSVVLDIGCGPLRLGSKIIETMSDGWYYGTDINAATLQDGMNVLERLKLNDSRATLIASESFEVDSIDREIDIAFSNSLFSHLNFNSMLLCLSNISEVLKSGGSYYSTFFLVSEGEWRDSVSHKMWEREFCSYPRKDPYHYTIEMMEALANLCGFDFSIDEGYGHQCQTMAAFTLV